MHRQVLSDKSIAQFKLYCRLYIKFPLKKNQLAVALQKGQMLLMHQGVTKLRHAQRLKAFK
jgi:hypothetical protein